jgi:hypothetical protein
MDNIDELIHLFRSSSVNYNNLNSNLLQVNNLYIERCLELERQNNELRDKIDRVEYENNLLKYKINEIENENKILIQRVEQLEYNEDQINQDNYLFD